MNKSERELDELLRLKYPKPKMFENNGHMHSAESLSKECRKAFKAGYREAVEKVASFFEEAPEDEWDEISEKCGANTAEMIRMRFFK